MIEKGKHPGTELLKRLAANLKSAHPPCVKVRDCGVCEFCDPKVKSDATECLNKPNCDYYHFCEKNEWACEQFYEWAECGIWNNSSSRYPEPQIFEVVFSGEDYDD